MSGCGVDSWVEWGVAGVEVVVASGWGEGRGGGYVVGGAGSDSHSPAPAIVFPNENQRRVRFLAAHGNGQIHSQLHGGGGSGSHGGGVRNHLISQILRHKKVAWPPTNCKRFTVISK